MLGQNQRKPRRQAICAPLISRSGRAFGQGFARPSAAAYAAAALRLMVRSASPSGRAAPALRHGSALRIRRALHRGGPPRGGYAPRSPVRSPRARLRSASASAVCAAAAGPPSGPAGRLRPPSRVRPGLRPWPLRGIGPRLRLGSGPAPGIAPLPYCESVPPGRVRAAPVARGKQPPRLYSPPRSRPQGSIRPAFGGASRPCPLSRCGLCCFAGGSPPACFFLWWALRAVLFRAPPPGGALVGAGRAAPGPAPLGVSGPPRARCGGDGG